MAALGTLIEHRALGSLVAYARNARTHSAEQVSAIAASMREWGWTMPILVAEACDGVADGEIIAGHGRVLAAQRLYEGGRSIKMASGEPIPMGEVPVIVARGWSADQRKAYVIADNQLTLSGGWDESILRLELIDLREVGFNLRLTGFDDTSLAGLLDVRLDVESDPEVAPPVPVVPVSRAGDVWLLGRHRLLCGDATKAADVRAILGGAEPHLMVTDPPYGVDYDPEWRTTRPSLWTSGGHVASGRVENDHRADWREAWVLFPGDVAYVWSASQTMAPLILGLETAGFAPRAHIVWVKSTAPIGRGDYHWQHENCWYAVREGKVGRFTGDRMQTTVWPIDKPQANETGHATQKPLECMRRPMENNSRPGETVYDPFVGSGTSIIAAEMSGRRCYAMEIAPGYCDVSVERWQNVTGLQAHLEADGQSFAMVREERLSPILPQAGDVLPDEAATLPGSSGESAAASAGCSE